MGGLRFGLLDVADAPFAELRERWQRVEELGFDFLFVADHYRHTRDASLPWFDGWTTLATMAEVTRSVRVGPLVANPVLRHPAVVAKAAAAIDHLSDGRLELALGKGVEPFDHRAVGAPYWSARERSARFRECVTIVDGLLRSSERSFSFAGSYYSTEETTIAPAPLQRPRPPLTLGGQSPSVRRLAAELGDCWNTFALGELPFEGITETVRAQNQELDALCDQNGRDPATLRRSLVLWKPLYPWETPDSFERIVTAFMNVGITEFHVMWPSGSPRLLDHAAELIASLRAT